jgi:Pentapeptide repeats (8 copies)
MILAVQAKVQQLIAQGKTRQEVLDAKVTAPYDTRIAGGLLPAGAGTSADRFVGMFAPNRRSCRRTNPPRPLLWEATSTANLTRATMYQANLSYAMLDRASLTDAILNATILIRANFRKATLRGTNLVVGLGTPGL